MDKIEILGAMILEEDLIGEISGILNDEDFSEGFERSLFRGIIDLKSNEIPVDLINLTEHFNGDRDLIQRLCNLCANAPAGQYDAVLNSAYRIKYRNRCN